MRQLEGNPLRGKDLEKLVVFLKKMELEYEEGIEYTVVLSDENDNILGTGSVEQNVIKCVAVAKDAQGLGISATILSNLIQYEFSQGRTNLFVYTKPSNRDMFESLGFYTVLMTEEVLFMENRKRGFEEFMERLVAETPKEALDKNATIGAIVANCNPFTFGHRYLIEEALKECDYVHLFILTDKRSFFSAEDRFQMVKEGVSDLERLILHRASDFIISAATFPTYFMKEQIQAQKANCRLDLELFGRRIAPGLHITKRFVGTEPTCLLTGSYNEEMKLILPNHGVKVTEIERKAMQEEAVSASKVRALLNSGDYEKIKKLVPETTLNYLLKRV